MPTLRWVNHASFVFEFDGTSLICDPWLSGTAFNRGWRLISPTGFSYQDFHAITHMWFSHQHPDHFAPPDLKQIPPDARGKITTLYHKTIDKKVVRFCKGIGFKSQLELTERWTPIADGVEVICGTWFDRDSWIAIRTRDVTILNLNDCVVDSNMLAKRIQALVGPIDVLLTQFSYAEYHGNVDDVAARRESAREKLRRIEIQVRAFRPKFVIPFASFIYWCHPENFHMNADMNRVGEVASFIESIGATPVVLYPGEQWSVGQPQPFAESAQRYAKDLAAKIDAGPTELSKTIPIDMLNTHAASFVNRTLKHNPMLHIVPLRPTTVNLVDHRVSVRLSMQGLSICDESASPDIRLHSESLLFCLKAPWGSNALRVNGRFESVAGRHERFFAFFKPEDWADHGLSLRPDRLPILISAAAFRLRSALARRIEAKIGRSRRNASAKNESAGTALDGAEPAVGETLR